MLTFFSVYIDKKPENYTFFGLKIKIYMSQQFVTMKKYLLISNDKISDIMLVFAVLILIKRSISNIQITGLVLLAYYILIRRSIDLCSFPQVNIFI